MARFIFAVIISLMPMGVFAKSIVVLGDSISAAYKIEAEQGWVALMQGKLDGIGKGHFIHNESVIGDTTAGGLARINLALALHKPDIVIVELGTNDGLRGLPPTVIKANLAEIALRTKQAGAKVLMMGMKLPSSFDRPHIGLFYNIYPELATELGLPYASFIMDDAALAEDMMQPDGLHPNAKGQPAILGRVWPMLLPLLK